jgi:Questin oxidase-like
VDAERRLESSSVGVLIEAYTRLHGSGPEWGEDQLTNHGPMAVEVLVRRGFEDEVDRWVDQYLRRLDSLPTATSPITDANWPQALGEGRRLGDWVRYFRGQLAEQPWREVLATWWPRLLPGIVAGTTHGVIRVGHAVRALLAAAQTPESITELAHGLAFWAARSRPVPTAGEPAGTLSAGEALDRIARVGDQSGTVAARFSQLAETDAWPASVAALRRIADPDDARLRLVDLVDAATVRYLTHGHASPVLLAHTATAPNAVLHILPALPRDLWVGSVSAIWRTTAAIVAAYAPREGLPRTVLPSVATTADALDDTLERAIAHGDEHVIKFTDTATEVYARTGHPDALAAAVHIGSLIERAYA